MDALHGQTEEDVMGQERTEQQPEIGVAVQRWWVPKFLIWRSSCLSREIYIIHACIGVTP